MSTDEHIIRIGIVGVGHLGLRHLEHALELKSADCTGFFDTDAEQTDLVSRKTGATTHKSLASLLEATDIVSIVRTHS